MSLRIVTYLIEYLGEFEFIFETVLGYVSGDQMGCFEAKKQSRKSHVWAPLTVATCQIYHVKIDLQLVSLAVFVSHPISFSCYPRQSCMLGRYDPWTPCKGPVLGGLMQRQGCSTRLTWLAMWLSACQSSAWPSPPCNGVLTITKALPCPGQQCSAWPYLQAITKALPGPGMPCYVVHINAPPERFSRWWQGALSLSFCPFRIIKNKEKIAKIYRTTWILPIYSWAGFFHFTSCYWSESEVQYSLTRYMMRPAVASPFRVNPKPCGYINWRCRTAWSHIWLPGDQ